jgi:xanthine dehydrogenase YagR molybdenum-binding subunit
MRRRISAPSTRRAREHRDAERAAGARRESQCLGIESAIDELAYEVGIDPLAIRLLNYAEHDHHANKPWSTRQLREAFAVGAERFGWSKAQPAPRSMREGHQLIGWGVAAGMYPMRRTAGRPWCASRRRMVEVVSAAIDMGQGTYTILAQTAAEALGVPVERVAVRLGDSDLPLAPVAGGSQLAGLMTGAVHKAAIAAATSDRPRASTIPNRRSALSRPTRLPLPTGGSTAWRLAHFLQAIGRAKIEPCATPSPRTASAATIRIKNYTTITTMRAPTDGAVFRHAGAPFHRSPRR